MDKLRALRYLEAAARGQSLSAAARHFEVSPAAVAKLVGALEGELGVRLVERRPRGLRLTAAGADYLDDCIPALRRLDAAENDVRATALVQIGKGSVERRYFGRLSRPKGLPPKQRAQWPL